MDGRSSSHGYAISEADALALEARTRHTTRRALRLQQMSSSRQRLVPSAGGLIPPPPRAVDFWRGQPDPKRSQRLQERYTMQFKGRMVNEMRRATSHVELLPQRAAQKAPEEATWKHSGYLSGGDFRLGGKPLLSLYESERLVRRFEDPDLPWEWPSKKATDRPQTVAIRPRPSWSTSRYEPSFRP